VPGIRVLRKLGIVRDWTPSRQEKTRVTTPLIDAPRRDASWTVIMAPRYRTQMDTITCYRESTVEIPSSLS
jgi:hypothetical protein